VIKHETYNAKEADSLLSLAKEFCAEFSGIHIDIFVIAIAGFVENHSKVRITNLPHWPIVLAEDFATELKISKVFILNDFEANGYGVQDLSPEDLISMTENEPVLHGVKGVVGAGTGLGEAYLAHRHGTDYYNVYPSEGGHTEFAGLSMEDYEFREYIKKVVKETEGKELTRISTERVVCGPALKHIYEFFRLKHYWLDQKLPDEIC